MFHRVLAGLALSLALLVFASPAAAQATRTWVSGVGDDANPCSRTAPCKTFAGAISKTAAGGEINVLDPGGFGAVTITKSISISAEGFEAGVLVSGTNGIIINAAATDVVTLRGLDFNGLGTGLAGIKVLSAGVVSIEKTTIDNFTNAGIDIENTSGTIVVSITNCILRNNSANTAGGILIKPAAGAFANVVVDNVSLLRNRFGLRAEDRSTVTVTNSTANGNTTNGFLAFSSAAATVVNLTTTESVNNTSAGVRADGAAAVVRINDTTISGNSIGLQTVNSGQIKSFGTNRVVGNTTDGSPTAPNLGQV